MEHKEENKPETSSPYLSKRIYKNYEKTMKEKNVKRKRDGLTSIHVKSFLEWSTI